MRLSYLLLGFDAPAGQVPVPRPSCSTWIVCDTLAEALLDGAALPAVALSALPDFPVLALLEALAPGTFQSTMSQFPARIISEEFVVARA